MIIFFKGNTFGYFRVTFTPVYFIFLLLSLRKTVGKTSPFLVTLTSRSDSDVEISNVSLKENKPDGVNPNSNDIDYYVRKNEGKILWFSADRFRCFQNPTCDVSSLLKVLLILIHFFPLPSALNIHKAPLQAHFLSLRH